MSPYAAPKPPKPSKPTPKLEIVPEVEAVPDEESDREPEVIELVSMMAPPPISIRRRDRVRRVAIGVIAAFAGLLVLVVALRPWRRIGGDAHVAANAHATISETFAKRAKPGAPPYKATVVAAQKKIAAPAKKAQPAAAPPKPIAKPLTKRT